jgi:predicted lipoprotein with Yx(FWY)xxD motif
MRPLPASLARLSLGLTLAALLGACAQMQSAPPPPAQTLDGVLVGPGQMTLYTFERDQAGAGKSVCNGPCAANWPPLMAQATDQPKGDWSIVMRDDGSRQWAYKGRPLYRWIKDQKPGDRTGDGVNQVWKTAKP